MTKFTEFSGAAALNAQFADEIARTLKQGIGARGYASLVVSGGRTPLGLFEALTQQTIPWNNVTITLADERWVGPEDDASNEKLVREHLLKGHAAQANFIGLKNDKATPFDGAAETERALQAIARPFDVVILGMGDDGHTASLFPGAENLYPALAMDSGRVCMGMTPLTAPLDRITLTLPALLNSRHIYLHLTGSGKREVYERAMQGQDVNEMPVRSVLHQAQVPVDVYWTA
ncbi:6-phosphogluconolactonase [Enterobacillus tribolii]|uniref:6-phosphogluconolactonase n=1 Tax=Enterobacillus tribolii TaxID=1487935 RepID=A0A370R4L5_9GAMM|nr:6-phosphogluconolactonase [Enterobacillus tribolii]MBW7983302.1 6-phosphogluconolactonase [Enterobacillus tribolii]RDK97360.1 6-phosphogluconolactonase [Enterobacillus tribolii]